MAKAVVLSTNIYGEDGVKYLRGDLIECSQGFIDMVLDGDAEAERDARLTQVDEKPKRGRPKKEDATDEDS